MLFLCRPQGILTMQYKRLFHRYLLVSASPVGAASAAMRRKAQRQGGAPRLRRATFAGYPPASRLKPLLQRRLRDAEG